MEDAFEDLPYSIVDSDLSDPWPSPGEALATMRMTQGTYASIMRELTSHPPEYGGMLLGPADSDLVTRFVPDEKAVVTSASYTLHAESLNAILQDCRKAGLTGKGLVHSHPAGCTQPSLGDLLYVRKALANPRNQTANEFLLPIVCDERMHPYVIRRRYPDRVLYAELILI